MAGSEGGTPAALTACERQQRQGTTLALHWPGWPGGSAEAQVPGHGTTAASRGAACGESAHLQGTHSCGGGLLCPQQAGGGVAGVPLRLCSVSVLEVAGRDLQDFCAAAWQKVAAGDDEAAIRGAGLQQADVAVGVPRRQHPALQPQPPQKSAHSLRQGRVRGEESGHAAGPKEWMPLSHLNNAARLQQHSPSWHQR